jgi:transketolase
MQLSKNLILKSRKRLLQMHFESGVGHIGGNLSCLDALLIIYHEFLTENDRFILSKGHSAGALYIALWSLGFINEESIKTFHKDNTLLAGHPPASGIPQIHFATGSLGHGFSLACGLAMGLRINQQEGRVFCITSDGEWQEGSTWEAFIFACHNQLNNLTILVDHNNLQGFGNTNDVASMSPLGKKLEGFDLIITEIDGHNIESLRNALNKKTDQCHLIIMNTTKGHGVSFMQNEMKWHYLPMTETQYKKALEEIENL